MNLKNQFKRVKKNGKKYCVMIGAERRLVTEYWIRMHTANPQAILNS